MKLHNIIPSAGWRTVRPVSLCHREEEVTETFDSLVRKAQHEILHGLAEFDMSVGVLYQAYATQFPSLSEFWKSLAHEETVQTYMLGMLETMLDRGQLFWNIGRFRPNTIKVLMHHVDKCIADAGDSDARQALSKTARIENSPPQAHFFDVVECSAPEFGRVATFMTRMSMDRRIRVHTQLAKHTHSHAKGCRDTSVFCGPWLT